MYFQIYEFILSVFLGAIGYYFVNFQMIPIIAYRKIKYQVVTELAFFANVVSYKKTQEEQVDKFYEDRLVERVLSFRRMSAELKATINFLPRWYFPCLLHICGEKPNQAVNEILKLSNCFDYREYEKIEKDVRKFLKLKDE